MRFRTSILLGGLIACAEPAIPTIPPVTSAHPDAPPLPATGAAAPTVRSKLETIDAELFLLYRSEKGNSCERATVKAPPANKGKRHVLELDASSPVGCWVGKATVSFTLDGDHADNTETHVSGSYVGVASRCLAPQFRDHREPPPNVVTVSSSELAIDGQRIFVDEASCKAALSANDASPPSTGCLAKALASAVNARKPPPTGAFVDRFEKLIKGGGTVYVPSETQKNVCITNQVSSKPEKVKDKDILRVTLTSTSVEEGVRWIDKAEYEYDPACRRARMGAVSGEGTAKDGSTMGRASSTHGWSNDLGEQDDTKDALPLPGPIFYSQNACVAWTKTQGTASSK